ncbi:hypothetical protein LY76DRAFT_647927 [Colletotrichum caudatum]|nr:hypothetical protein LY76DRAFT_647927 [Colletotrichum caudatum]
MDPNGPVRAGGQAAGSKTSAGDLFMKTPVELHKAVLNDTARGTHGILEQLLHTELGPARRLRALLPDALAAVMPPTAFWLAFSFITTWDQSARHQVCTPGLVRVGLVTQGLSIHVSRSQKDWAEAGKLTTANAMTLLAAVVPSSVACFCIPSFRLFGPVTVVNVTFTCGTCWREFPAGDPVTEDGDEPGLLGPASRSTRAW